MALPTDVQLARLHPADIEAIARRVVEQLRDDPSDSGHLVDAATIAREFGVSRAFVYAHADELGAVKLGDGPRSRLRFSPAKAAEALSVRSTSKVSAAPPAPRRRGSRPASPGVTRAGNPLLPLASSEDV
jgi:hypothetical protein